MSDFDESGEYELIQRLRALLRARGTPGIVIMAEENATTTDRIGLLNGLLADELGIWMASI